MRAAEYLNVKLKEAVEKLGLAWPEKVQTEQPKERKFGDLACNVAMLLAKKARRAPRDIAAELAASIQNDRMISTVEVAGAGFINVCFAPEFWHCVVLEVLGRNVDFGSIPATDSSRKVQIEFVSANPTGPLHIGHGRGAAMGDSLARLLRFTGHKVECEYYVNDAGRQMATLGNSVWVRALELAGRKPEIPEDFYKGDYIIGIARDMLERRPDLLELSPEEGRKICFEYAHKLILEWIREDLEEFRVKFDMWSSERAILQSGAVDSVLKRFEQDGLLFEEEGALWFKSSSFGDDKDRVLRKSNGDLTYVTTDIAYHEQKYERGFDLLVDVLGADHHGYIPRMKAALQALGHDPAAFEAIIIQLVNWLKGGEQVAMSTRAGQFETLIDVLDEVGVDAARFMFLSRKGDSPLDFDLELVKSKSMDNPVYYVQYAHARICNLFSKAGEKGLFCGDYREARTSPGELACLSSEDDLQLVRMLDAFPAMLGESAAMLAPHHISFYLMELAAGLHSYYAAVPILAESSMELVKARLSMLAAVGYVLKTGLNLLGVSAPEKM